MNDIITLLAVIPTVINYILPGVVFFIVVQYVSFDKIGVNLKDFGFVKIILASHIIISLVDTFWLWNESHWKTLLLIAMAMTLGLIFGLFKRWKWLNEKIMVKLFRRTLNDGNMWADILDVKYGAYVTIPTKDGQIKYKGGLIEHFKENGEIWLKLQNYQIIYADKNVSPIDYREKNNFCLLLNIANFTAIHIRYHPNSLCFDSAANKDISTPSNEPK